MILNSYGLFSITIILIGALENRSFRKYQKCEEILLKFIHFLLNVWFLNLNFINHFMYNVKKWSNILKPLSSNPQNGQAQPTIPQQNPTNCLNAFNHFVGLALKGFKYV